MMPDPITKIEHRYDDVTSTDRSRFVQWCLKFLVAWTIIVGIGFWWWCFFLTWPGEWVNIFFNHFPVTMGIPAAMLGAVIICTLFRTIDGHIKLGGLGLTFEGAAGPIVMWVLCFLAFVTSVRVLWPLTTH